MRAEYEDNREFNMCLSQNSMFPAHYHTHVEIKYIIKGSIYVYINGSEYIANENDVIFILPHQIHSFRSVSYNEFSVLQISHSLFAGYLELPCDKELENPVISVRDQSTVDIFRSIHSYIFSHYPSNVLNLDSNIYVDSAAVLDTSVKALLAAYVSLILDGAKWVKKGGSKPDISRKIIEFCYENYKYDISLASVAEAIGVSECTVTRMFSSVFKSNFREYINNLRLSDVSCALTTTNTPITEIAYACGFENLRTFNRVFFAHYGTTPSEYRKMYGIKQ